MNQISMISNCVGASLGTLHKVSSQIDRLLREFGQSERDRLEVLMPSRKITGCEDETFFDGTTAAERFFLEKPKDLFSWLLERVSFPVRPRNKRERLRLKICQVASDTSDLEIAI